MTTTNYNVNGLLDVVVAADIHSEVLREIDFQIGFFRQTPLPPEAGRACIKVRPFTEYSSPGNPTNSNRAKFYNYQGQPSIELVNESSRLAIARAPAGFNIYADHPNFLINLYIQLLIVPMGFTMIHAAGYLAANGSATLVAGAGGIGKTAILGHAVSQRVIAIK